MAFKLKGSNDNSNIESKIIDNDFIIEEDDVMKKLRERREAEAKARRSTLEADYNAELARQEAVSRQRVADRDEELRQKIKDNRKNENVKKKNDLVDESSNKIELNEAEELKKKQEIERNRLLEIKEKMYKNQYGSKSVDTNYTSNNSHNGSTVEKIKAEYEKRMDEMRISNKDKNKIKAEEEAIIETEKRVQTKAMDQREALIAAVRAQVEKEKAAKEERIKREEEEKARYSKGSAGGNSENKQTFRPISPEEAKKLEEKQRQKMLYGVEGKKENNNEPTLDNLNLGGVTLENPIQSGPSLTSKKRH